MPALRVQIAQVEVEDVCVVWGRVGWGLGLRSRWVGDSHKFEKTALGGKIVFLRGISKRGVMLCTCAEFFVPPSLSSSLAEELCAPSQADGAAGARTSLAQR